VTAQKTDAATGKLLFNTGNICTHLYSLDFLQRSCEQYATLAKHVAHKAIPHYDAAAKTMVFPAKVRENV
jgi:UDP-N-acetylglucosamine pyrophosphorylase